MHSIDKEKEYFEPDYLASRRKVVEEYKELAEQQLPPPEKNWGIIWPLSGPEMTFEEHAPIFDAEKHKETSYNQTKNRFETALNIIKQVTALRANKDLERITMTDIEQIGPVLYWNAEPILNDYLAELILKGELKKRYNFPANKIIITTNKNIVHTDDQFNDFPMGILPSGEKVIIVTDFYHLPRIKRYVQKHADKFSLERTVLYPSQPSCLPIKMALQEIKKMHKYSKKGILPSGK